jgi:hydroxyacylglutathione hydrolase
MKTDALAPAVVRSLQERGTAVLLDLRPSTAFVRGHPAGALSVPFSARGLAQRARIAVPSPAAAIALVAPDEPTADDAAAQLAASGIQVRGVLDGGFAAWQAAGLPTARLVEVAIEELPRRSGRETVVDVREPLEWSTGHVPGALLIPLGTLRDQLTSIPRNGRVIVICEAGVRSCTAASILRSEGFPDVAHVPAGSSGYRRSGLPLEFPSEEVVVR